jgi:hypothetical protein
MKSLRSGAASALRTLVVVGLLAGYATAQGSDPDAVFNKTIPDLPQRELHPAHLGDSFSGRTSPINARRLLDQPRRSFLPRLDDRIARRALLKRTGAGGDQCEHPCAVQTLFHQIPLLDRIVDEVKHQRSLWPDDWTAGTLAVAKHDLHVSPFDRHDAGIGAVVDDMVAPGRRAPAEEERGRIDAVDWADRLQSPSRNDRATVRLRHPSRSIVPPGCHCSRPQSCSRKHRPGRSHPAPGR